MQDHLKAALVFLLLLAGASADEGGYDRYRQPEKILGALRLRRGQKVADIGAGGGYLTFRMADAVGPDGLVVATDIADESLAVLRKKAEGRPNVLVRKAVADEPGLEVGRYDLVLLAEVDQYLPDRVAYLKKLRAALAPNGRIAVTNRVRFREAVVQSAAKAGYAVVGCSVELPAQFILFLEPRRGPP